MIYYIVELNTVEDNSFVPVLVSEEQLADFVKNLDKQTYFVVNVHGVGELKTNVADFVKKEQGLEHGKDISNA